MKPSNHAGKRPGHRHHRVPGMAKCPRCGRPGSPQLKSVRNRKGGRDYRYVYFAHATGPHSIKWCYVGGRSSLPPEKGRERKKKERG